MIRGGGNRVGRRGNDKWRERRKGQKGQKSQ